MGTIITETSFWEKYLARKAISESILIVDFKKIKGNFGLFFEAMSNTDQIKSMIVSNLDEFNGVAGIYQKKLERVAIIDGTKTINPQCFSYCGKLERIDLPQTLNTIKAKAFYGCNSLKEISLPKTLIDIEEEAFSKCSNLKSVIANGYLEDVPRKCFEENTSLETVVFKNGVHSIQFQAFAQCHSLKHVEFNGAQVYINKNAFSECYSLKHIEIPAFSTVRPMGFLRCSNLETVTFGEGVSLSAHAFMECQLLSPETKKAIKIINPSSVI